jgi:hypothetical protein
MSEQFNLNENLAIYEKFHKLAAHCLESTDIKLRQMGTELSELATSINPGDDSAPYHKLYDLENRINAYIQEQGFKTERETIKDTSEYLENGELNLSNFEYSEFRTTEKEPNLPQEIKGILKQSKDVYSKEDGSFKFLRVFETPGGQLLVIERYIHSDYEGDDLAKQIESNFFDGFHYGYEVYSISMDEFEKNNRSIDFRKI